MKLGWVKKKVSGQPSILDKIRALSDLKEQVNDSAIVFPIGTIDSQAKQ